MRRTEKRLRELASKKTWKAEDATFAVEAAAVSEKTEAAFCREFGIHQGRLSRWRRNLEGESLKESALVFHEVKMREPDTGALAGTETMSTTLEVVTTGGRRITVNEGFDQTLLQRVILAVESMPC